MRPELIDEDALASLLNRFHKPLVVHGKSYEGGCIQSVMDDFLHVEFTDFAPNPKYESVCAGVDLFRAEQCDVIVAVGGGSAIDVAKCIKLFCRLSEKQCYLFQEWKDTCVPLIAIPTTAGTGSEATRHAVIYYEGKKQSVSDQSIIPDYVCLIPKLLVSLPEYQKKCTLLDALCQAVESWWSVNATEESISFSERAIRKIRDGMDEYLDRTADQPGWISAAQRVMLGAFYSGNAINITATTAAHAMSYKITSMYGYPHGHAVAMCMVEVWKYLRMYVSEHEDEAQVRDLAKRFRELEQTLSYDEFLQIYSKLGMQASRFQVGEDEIEMLVASVNPERLKNYPITLSEDVIRKMYMRITGYES